MCFCVFCVCVCVCVWKREKCVEKFGREKNSEKCLPLLVYEVLGAVYSPGTLFEAMALVVSATAFQRPPASTSSDRVNLDTFGKVLTSCF